MDWLAQYWYVLLPIIIIALPFLFGVMDDVWDFFLDGGWGIVVGLVALAGIVCGYIFWNWFIMTIILAVLILAGGIVGIIIWRANRGIPLDKMTSEQLRIFCIANNIKGYDKMDREQLIIAISEWQMGIRRGTSNYKCENCGARLIKISFNNNREKDITFKCGHCNIEYSAQEVTGETEHDEEQGDDTQYEVQEEIDLTDFEEEYFEACQTFDFRPYNTHSENQFKRRYEKLQDDYICDGEVDDAYEYFQENIGDINEYLKNNTEEEVKKRFEYFLSL